MLINAGRIASVQIAFRNNNLIRSTPFNIKMGSGTGNGCGEENKFLLDCLKKRVQIKYIPSDNIARISTEGSLKVIPLNIGLTEDGLQKCCMASFGEYFILSIRFFLG